MLYVLIFKRLFIAEMFSVLNRFFFCLFFCFFCFCFLFFVRLGFYLLCNRLAVHCFAAHSVLSGPMSKRQRQRVQWLCKRAL